MSTKKSAEGLVAAIDEIKSGMASLLGKVTSLEEKGARESGGSSEELISLRKEVSKLNERLGSGKKTESAGFLEELFDFDFGGGSDKEEEEEE